MNVTQIIYTGMGGHCSVAFSLIEANVNKLWNNNIVFYGVENIVPEYKKRCLENKIQYFVLKFKSGKFLIKWIKLYKILKKINPDRIILHTNCIIPVFFYCFINKKKFIFIEHNPNNSKILRDWVVTYLAFITASKVVLLHKTFLKELKNKFKFFLRINNKYEIIYNGINHNKFSPKDKINFRKNAKILIGMASRLTSTKNHFLIINMIITNKSYFKKNNIQFSIAGDGPLFKKLNSLIKKNNIENIIKLEGYLEENQLIKWYRSISIYIHSTFSETQSMSIIQAMSFNIPIIVSNIDNIKDNLQANNAHNFFVVENEKKAFFNKIIYIIKNLEYNVIKYNSRETILEHFNYIKMFEKYNNLLN